MQSRRIFLIVLDGVGIRALPDAERFWDEGSNTLVNTARAGTALSAPFLQTMGLDQLASIPGVPPVRRPAGAYGILQEADVCRKAYSKWLRIRRVAWVTTGKTCEGGNSGPA